MTGMKWEGHEGEYGIFYSIMLEVGEKSRNSLSPQLVSEPVTDSFVWFTRTVS